MRIAATAVVNSETRATTVHVLGRILSRTLPEEGLDRMTGEKVEEVLAVTALTAHI